MSFNWISLSHAALLPPIYCPMRSHSYSHMDTNSKIRIPGEANGYLLITILPWSSAEWAIHMCHLHFFHRIQYGRNKQLWTCHSIPFDRVNCPDAQTGCAWAYHMMQTVRRVNIILWFRSLVTPLCEWGERWWSTFTVRISQPMWCSLWR